MLRYFLCGISKFPRARYNLLGNRTQFPADVPPGGGLCGDSTIWVRTLSEGHWKESSRSCFKCQSFSGETRWLSCAAWGELCTVTSLRVPSHGHTSEQDTPVPAPINEQMCYPAAIHCPGNQPGSERLSCEPSRVAVVRLMDPGNVPDHRHMSGPVSRHPQGR